MKIPFVHRLKEEDVRRGIQVQDNISEMLKAAANPPGFFSKLFGLESNDEFEQARDALNPTGHGASE